MIYIFKNWQIFHYFVSSLSLSLAREYSRNCTFASSLNSIVVARGLAGGREDQSSYQDEPSRKYIFGGESRHVIANISQRNRGRGIPYSTSFLLSMNEMKPEFSPRKEGNR